MPWWLNVFLIVSAIAAGIVGSCWLFLRIVHRSSYRGKGANYYRRYD